MSLRLSIFTKKVIQNKILPNISDSDYAIVLDRAKFGLKKNLILELQIVDGLWSFKQAGYSIIRDDGQAYDVPIGDGAWYTLSAPGEEIIKISVSEIEISFDRIKKYYLAQGTDVTIGRSDQCTICYSEQSYIGREHAIIQFNGGKWRIKDKSKNGIFVNGKRVNGEQKLSIGDRIELYDLKIIYLGGLLAIGANDNVVINESVLRPCKEEMSLDIGDIETEKKPPFHRSPRSNPKIYSEQIEIEAPPALKAPEKLPLIMTIGPSLTMAIPMALGCGMSMLSRGGSGAFMYTGIITAVGSAVIGTIWTLARLRHSNKKYEETERKRFDAYAAYLVGMAEKVKEMYTTNTESMRSLYPSADECGGYSRDSILLWNRNTRHSDMMYYRLGTGEMDFQTQIAVPKAKFTIEQDELAVKPQKIHDDFETLYDVPIGVDLLEHRLVGIVGGTRKEGAFEVVKCISTQIAASNSYTDVKMCFVYNKDEEIEDQWGFAKWFPHVWMEEKKGRFIASNRREASNLFYELTNILRVRSENTNVSSFGKKTFTKPHFVLFIEESEWLEGEPIVKYLNENKEEYGITTVLLAEDYTDLPNTCDYIIYNNEEYKGISDMDSEGDTKTEISFDKISNEKIDTFSRRLMSIEVSEVEMGADVVSSLDFFEMYRVRALEEFKVTERWKKNRTYDSMKALIGQKAGGADCYLDIHEKYHGPHGLIAGTTGSGKSETLQTYMLSLAINFSPYDIAFFVIDFKGGGMANLFSELPHSVGSISNLSGSQVRRAMLSIKSENMRRQRIFSENGVNNINNYTKLLKNNEASIPVPHLFIIIDEFAELKKEEPEFMKELISVAQVGRSLGVHLILATQKPSGTVDDNIWSNSKFRLCLRVQDRQDSNDMLHKPDAAYITQAGRGYLQVGNDELYEHFQSGWSGAPYSDDIEDTTSDIAVLIGMDGKTEMVGSKQKIQQKERKYRQWIGNLSEFTDRAFASTGYTPDMFKKNTAVSAEIVDHIIGCINEKGIKFDDNSFNRIRIEDFIGIWRDFADAEDRVEKIIKTAELFGTRLPEMKEITQLDAVVEYLGKVAKENGYKQSMQLWLPVLPSMLYLNELQGYYEASGAGNNYKRVSHQDWELEAYIGKYDDPSNQAQNPVIIDFATGGHLAVCGMVVSGKSTFMQTLIYSLISRYSSEHINLYLFDFSSKMMSAFEGSNHVGGIMYESDLEKIKKFFNMISEIIQERKEMFRGGNYAQYVKTHGLTLPAIFICIDNYEGFRNKTANVYDEFMLKLSSEAVGYGIYLVLTSGGFSTNEIPNSLGENIKTVISLEMPDKFKYGEVLKTMKIDTMPETNVRGRGMAIIDDRVLEFQTALAIEAPDDYSRLELINEQCLELNKKWNTAKARHIPEIPKDPTWKNITEDSAYNALITDDRSLPIAYNEENASIYSLDLSKMYCYTLLGRKRTGKTTMLKIMARAFKDKDADICIIDDDSNGLKSFAGEIGAEYVNDEASMCEYFDKLIPVFIERNKVKKEYVAQGLNEEEIYVSMQQTKRIAVFINNFEAFIEIMKKPLKNDKYNFASILENLLDKGTMHNIYFIGAVMPESHSTLVGSRIYSHFIDDRQGMLLGGNAVSQKLFSFGDMKFSEQSKVYKPGIGLTTTDTSGTIKLVLPNETGK